MSRRSGFTFIEILISLGLLVILFSSIFLAYSSVVDLVINFGVRSAAAAALNRQVEIIRNLPYQSVGTVGGIPAGILPQNQTINHAGYDFTLHTTVRNIDDPFDGSLGSNPNDTAPADYKLVELEIDCIDCGTFTPLVLTTRVAPKGLENTSNNGALFINVFDASGVPIPEVNIHVVNASVTPSIDLNDQTNVGGVLQLVDIPTSTQSYQVSVGLPGYSTERTYPQGAPGNPNPVKPHATVAQQVVTLLSFSIDKISSLKVKTIGPTCIAYPSKSFSIAGSKLIGTPHVLKYSKASTTDANGLRNIASLEWDTYDLDYNGTEDLVGTIPLAPLIIAPSSSQEFDFILSPPDPNALLVIAADQATGVSIDVATAVLTKSGFSKTQQVSRSTLIQTSWAGNNYNSQDGGLDALGGDVKLLSFGGIYSTSTESWLISKTFDVGSSTASYYTFSWNPASQPTGTTLRFQIASNNDDATWNFIGPDGTMNTYYTTPNVNLSADHLNHRYLRYKVFLSTTDEFVSPTLQDLSIEFNSVCVPPAQTLYTGLASGSYNVNVSAAGYENGSSTVSVSSNWQSVKVLLKKL